MASIFHSIGIDGIPDNIDEALVFPKTYQYLYDAIKMGPLAPSKKEREASVKAYLRGWYKRMNGCYWHNRHKARVPTFFGYWALETALVTLLFDLDDSSYKHLPYYPRDWVEESRNQDFDKLKSQGKLPKTKVAFPETTCPMTGKWQSNLSAEVITLKEGDIMPGSLENENEAAYFWVFQVS
jgi:hypothetical protein